MRRFVRRRFKSALIISYRKLNVEIRETNILKRLFFEITDEIFQKFDNYEIWPCALLEPTGTAYYEICDTDFPDIAIWSVYGHFKTGGIECISDHETYEEAKEFMENLPPMPRTPITPF